MAIRRISELDVFTNSDLSQFLSTVGVTDSSQADYYDSNMVPDKKKYDPEKLSVGLWFEVSTPLNGLSNDGVGWMVKPTNEAVSYYLSKRINLEDVGKMLLWELNKFKINVLCGPINYIGSQNFGEPLCVLNDGQDTVWYDDRDTIIDSDGNSIPNRLCVMISTDFTNQTTFHNHVDFHSNVSIEGPDNNNITFHTTNEDNRSWHSKTINLSGPWAEFNKDILVDGTAYINNANILNLSVDGDIYGCCLSAKWADLAENYESDNEYPPGTLVQFGGKKEITIATDNVNAVITTKPGFSLNSNAINNNLGIALVGRVPVRVVGKVRKFNKIGLSEIPGIGTVVNDGKYIGIALDSSENEHVKLVECVVQLTL